MEEPYNNNSESENTDTESHVTQTVEKPKAQPPPSKKALSEKKLEQLKKAREALRLKLAKQPKEQLKKSPSLNQSRSLNLLINLKCLRKPLTRRGLWGNIPPNPNLRKR